MVKELVVPRDRLNEDGEIWVVDLVYCVENVISNKVSKSLIVTNNVKNSHRTFNDLHEYVAVEDGMEMEIYGNTYTINMSDQGWNNIGIPVILAS